MDIRPLPVDIGLVVPAHKERERIGGVLRLAQDLAGRGLVQAVCIVSHCSNDGTAEFAADFDPSFQVIETDQPGRKDTPLLVGIQALRGYSSIMTMDADLHFGHLPEEEHVSKGSFAEQMISVHQESGGEFAVLSPLDNGWYSQFVPHAGLTGQRILPTDLILGMPFAGMNGWGFEIKTSLEAWRKGILKTIDQGVQHTPKIDKHGRIQGFIDNVSMGVRVADAGLAHMIAIESNPRGYLTVAEVLNERFALAA